MGILKFQKDSESDEVEPWVSCITTDSIFYSGQVDENLLPHGIGREVRKDGSIAEGQFTNGWLNGWARQIEDDGAYTVGWFKDSEMNGYAK